MVYAVNLTDGLDSLAGWNLTVAFAAYGVITFLTAWNMYLWPLIVVRSTELKVVPMAIAELSSGFSQNRGVEMAPEVAARPAVFDATRC